MHHAGARRDAYDKTNFEAATVFIDQLEMLRSKTRGNLDAEEARLLEQVLDLVRTAFVEVIDAATSTAKDGA